MKQVFRRLAGTSVLALVAAAASPALATTFAYDSYAVLNEQIVTITGLNGHTIDGQSAITGGAGEIILHGTNSIDLEVWCVDIFDWLQGSGSFTYHGPSNYDAQGKTGPAALTNTQIGEIGGLIAYFNAHSSDGDYNLSAATQIAIWETEYGTTNYQFSAPAAVLGDVSALLALSLTPNSNWDVLISVADGNANNQAQALLLGPPTPNSPPPVPEPAALAVFGSALVGFAVLRRRDRKR